MGTDQWGIDHDALRTAVASVVNGLTAAEQFFYHNAGSSYDPAKETQQEGRIRGAREYAAAEAWAKSVGMVFVWERDDDYIMSELAQGEEFETCEWAAAYMPDQADQANPIPFASLGGITDADADYRRLTNAELAMEARINLERANAHAKLIAPILEDLKAAREKLNRAPMRPGERWERNMSDAYIDEVEMTIEAFRYSFCEECGEDLDAHMIGPDPLGHVHVYCLNEAP